LGPNFLLVQEDAQKEFISHFKNSLMIFQIKLELNGYWCLILRDYRVQRELMMNMIERLYFLQCYQLISWLLIIKERSTP